MSEAVERRIVAMLDKPLVCPHGNPIPGLDELGLPFRTADDHTALLSLTAAATDAGRRVVVDRISEQIQPDVEAMRLLTTAGLRPGRSVLVRHDADGVTVGDDSPTSPGNVAVERHLADHVFVRTD